MIRYRYSAITPAVGLGRCREARDFVELSRLRSDEDEEEDCREKDDVSSSSSSFSRPGGGAGGTSDIGKKSHDDRDGGGDRQRNDARGGRRPGGGDGVGGAYPTVIVIPCSMLICTCHLRCRCRRGGGRGAMRTMIVQTTGGYLCAALSSSCTAARGGPACPGCTGSLPPHS
jgi:hypothetical protein